MSAKAGNVNMAMNNGLSRRLFLKVMPAAPMAAQDVAKQAGIADLLGSAVPVHGPPIASGSSAMKLVALKRSGLLPDWFWRTGRKAAKANARVLDPDLAALRSVSVSAKVAIQADRNFNRDYDNLEQEALDEQMRGKFFGWLA